MPKGTTFKFSTQLPPLYISLEPFLELETMEHAASDEDKARVERRLKLLNSGKNADLADHVHLTKGMQRFLRPLFKEPRARWQWEHV